MSEHDYLERLARRIMMMVAIADTPLSNDAGPIQELQVRIDEREIIDEVPRLQEFGFTSRPPNGTDVVLVFVNGDRSRALAIGTNHQASRPRNLKPGESMLFSEDGKYIHMTADGGIVVDVKGQPVTVNNASDVTVNASGKLKVVAPGGITFETPKLTVTGDVLDQRDNGGITMAAMRSVFNGHDHGGVSSGGANTAAPNEQM